MDACTQFSRIMTQAARYESSREQLPVLIDALEDRFTTHLHLLIDQLQFYANTETHRLVNFLTRLDYNLYYSKAVVMAGSANRQPPSDVLMGTGGSGSINVGDAGNDSNDSKIGRY